MTFVPVKSASGFIVEEPDVPRGSIVEEPEVQSAIVGQNSDSDNGEELSQDRCDTKSGGFWKAGARFSGVDETTGQFVSGKIIDRAGKARGRNRNCYNIQRDDGWRGWFNFRYLKDLSVIPESSEATV